MADILIMDRMIDVTNISSEIQALLAHVRPKWTMDSVSLEIMKGGLNNKMWKVCSKNDNTDILIVRIFGSASDKSYQREHQFKVFQALHCKGIISPIYCKFSNGYVYQYQNGETLTAENFLDPHIYKQIIAKMHEIHQIDMSRQINMADRKSEFTLMTKRLCDWLMSSESSYLDEDKWFREHFVSRQALYERLDPVCKLVDGLMTEFPVVFTHGNLHFLNILYDDHQDAVHFIDWDTTGMDCEVLEIASHWCVDPQYRLKEAGYVIGDMNDFYTAWLRHYLKTHPGYREDDVIPDAVLQTWLTGCMRACYAKTYLIVIWNICNLDKIADFDTRRWAADSYKTMQRFEHYCQ